MYSDMLVRYRTATLRRQEGRETKTRLGWQVRGKDARPTWSIVEVMGGTDPCRRGRATMCRLAGKGSGLQRLGMSKFGLMESVSGHYTSSCHLEIAVGSGPHHLFLMPVLSLSRKC